jgi:hypothetical protein
VRFETTHTFEADYGRATWEWTTREVRDGQGAGPGNPLTPDRRKVPLSDTVAEALADDAWRERQREYRKRARKRGNRMVTICGRQRRGQ